MLSKISSSDRFSKALFIKNIKRLWPIWGSYSFILFWLLYALTFIELKFTFFSDYDKISLRTLDFIYTEETEICLWIAIFFSVLMALGNFSYLGTEKSCYFIHALPLKRETLFGTNFISGLLMMYVPNVVFYLLTNVLCIKEGFYFIKALSVWLLVISVEELFFYAMAVLCLIIVGHNIAGSVFYGVLLGLAEILTGLINGIFENLYYGVGTRLVSFRNDYTCIISPIRFFIRMNIYRESSNTETVEPVYIFEEFWPVMIGAFVTALLFIAAAILLYRVRKSERSGDVVAIDFLRPVFRWFFGISIALLFTFLINETLFYTFKYRFIMLPITFVLIMVFGIVAYLAAEMIIRKNFRIFSGLGRQFVLYACCLAAASLLMLGLGHRMIKTYPDPSKVSAARLSIYGNEYMITDPEMIRELIDVHKVIVDEYDEIRESDEIDTTTWITLTLEYYLEKREVYRQYSIPVNNSNINKAIDGFCIPHTRELSLDVLDFSKIISSSIGGNFGDEYGYFNINEAQTRELIEELKKDIDEGRANLYDLAGEPWLYSSYSYDPVNDESFTLELQFSYDKQKTDSDVYWKYDQRTYRRISINGNCRHAINYIIYNLDFYNQYDPTDTPIDMLY